MAGVFSNLKPKNTVQRNGFDLSRRSVFSAKCGQILPVFVQSTLPDSEYRIDVKQLLRTQPLQTAAFSGFSVNYDFFFVPNNYGFSSFNEFISQRKDQRHVGQPNNAFVPRFKFRNLLQSVILCAAYDMMLSEHMAQKPVGEHVTSDDLYLPHFIVGSRNLPWASVCLEVIRGLDMFGYGNYLPLVKELSRQMWSMIATQISDENQDKYEFFEAGILMCAQLLIDEHYSFSNTNSIIQVLYALKNVKSTDPAASTLGFVDKWVVDAFDNIPDIEPTLWPFLAYNKGFYEYYRSVYYDEQFSLSMNVFDVSDAVVYNMDYVQLYNFDDWSSMYILGDYDPVDSDKIFARLCSMMMPKNHLYKKDLFTGVLPSTQFGDISVMLTDSDYRSMLSKSDVSVSSGYNLTVKARNGSSTPKKEGLILGTDSAGSFNDMQFRFDPALAISVLEQRRADAMQRFKERMLRAGNKVKDVFKAHGWSEPYSANEASPIFLGTFDGRLDINTVAATSPSEGVELAQLGANGTAVVQGSKIHFKSHDFGVIVGVLYIVKDAEYDAYGVEKQHCLIDPFDYPYPELQNISLHPIDTLEVSAYMRGLRGVEIIGYLPRFMEYKTAQDKVHGEFHTAPIYADDSGNEPIHSGGVFSDWVTPRHDLNCVSDVSFLYQSPDIADNIFLEESSALQSSDPFLINCLFDCMAVEPISVIGLPI